MELLFIEKKRMKTITFSEGEKCRDSLYVWKEPFADSNLSMKNPLNESVLNKELFKITDNKSLFYKKKL